MEQRETLYGGIVELSLPCSEEKIEKLLIYLKLLQKWNKVYNLTSVRDPKAMIGLHLLDSLAVSNYVEGNRILDVGTGAGLPGIPLAIFNPEKQFYLLDSNQKKTRFVQQAVIELGLNNVTVIARRVEQFQPEEKFDIIISRAFARIKDMVDAAHHLIRENGFFLAMKGRNPSEEASELKNSTHQLVTLQVPTLGAERHLVIVPADTINKN